MFKVVDGDDGTLLEDVLFYGISAKRYVIFRRQGDNITILKASSHGLKHLKNPFRIEDREWHKEIWHDILQLHYGHVTTEDLDEKYSYSYAMAELDISTPTIMRRFERFNKGKAYHKKIKPFNFCIVGISNFVDPDSGEAIKPLTSFTKDAQAAPHDYFVDYRTCRQLRGSHYWKRFNKVLWDYISHQEAKFDGDVANLARKHVKVKRIIHVGKESNDLEVTQIMGVQGNETVIYSSAVDILECNKDFILRTRPAEVQRFGIIPRTWIYIQGKLRAGQTLRLKSKTMNRISEFITSKRLGS